MGTHESTTNSPVWPADSPHEVAQVLRALRSEGPQSSEDLASLVGARLWEPGHFERAVLDAITSGRII